MKEFKIEQRTVFGIFIILIGAVLLLSSLGIIGADISIGTFWPVILIVLGIIRIVNFDESTFLGFVFLILGVYFQLKNLNVAFIENLSLSGLIWPLAIIVFGLSLILPDKFKSKKYKVSSDVYVDGENNDY